MNWAWYAELKAAVKLRTAVEWPGAIVSRIWLASGGVKTMTIRNNAAL